MLQPIILLSFSLCFSVRFFIHSHVHTPFSNMYTYSLDTDKQPLVLVACGSFSPITYLHLRMFGKSNLVFVPLSLSLFLWHLIHHTRCMWLEMAKDRVNESPRYHLIGGYFSPTSDAYNKLGLAAGIHRIKMCQAAVADSTWINVDPWEASQMEWQRTAVVLDHFQKYINDIPRQKGSILCKRRLLFSFHCSCLWLFTRSSATSHTNHVASWRRPDRVFWHSFALGPYRCKRVEQCPK